MTRVKSPSARRHRKVLDQAKGYRQARSSRYQVAQEAVLHAGQHAYIGRKRKKRDLRALWIVRLNAAVREYGMTYGRFISALKIAKIEIDRKILSALAIEDSVAFKKIVDSVKKES